MSDSSVPSKVQRMKCPFCFQFHDDSTTRCEERDLEIPQRYIERVNENVPVIPMLAIGFSGHGKTCFLSSLFHYLLEGPLSHKWPGFNWYGLNSETLNRVRKDYVDRMQRGQIPPPTPGMFKWEDGGPLILELQNVPRFVRLRFGRWGIGRQDVIFLFFDIGGEACEDTEKILKNFPFFQEFNPLTILIDLTMLIKEGDEKVSNAMQRMHQLMNMIYVMPPEITRTQDVLICYVKADRMWGQSHRFGPLAVKTSTEDPTPDKIPAYLDEFEDLEQNRALHLWRVSAFLQRAQKQFQTSTFYNSFSLGL